MKRNKWAEELIKGNSVIYEKPIELRSEKVRNIIGQVPSILLRYGIVIIGLSLLTLIGVSAFIPYHPSIDTEITIEQDTSGGLYYTTRIPENVIHKRAEFSEVVSQRALEFSLPTHFSIEEISETVTVSEEEVWRITTVKPTTQVVASIEIEKTITLPAKLMLKKQSVLMWMVAKVFKKR